MPLLKARPTVPMPASKAVLLTPSQNARLADSWLRTFPADLTDANFALCRLMQHGLLVRESHKQAGRPQPEALSQALTECCNRVPHLVAWLDSMPANVDLSFTLLYPCDAETVGNCGEFDEFDFDDDAVVYFEELKACLQDSRA